MLLRVEIHRFYSISVKSCHTDRRSHHDAVCQTMQFYLWSCSQHPAPALQLSGWGRPLILPDNVPSKNTSQGKEKLLAALNTVDIRRPETTQDSYIQGADSVAETIFLCIQKESGNNAAAAIELLSESRDTGLSNCADVVLNRLSPSPDETYLVSYALLSADVLEDGALRGDADLSGVALTLLTNRTLLVYSDSSQRTASQKTGFAVGVIGGQALVVAVFVS